LRYHLHRRTVPALLALTLAGPAVAVGTLTAAPAGAATCTGTHTWTDAIGDHAWATAGNWSPAGVPASDDAVAVNAGATITGATGAVCDLTVGGSSLAVTGTFTVNGRLAASEGTSFSFADGAGMTLAGTGLLTGAVTVTRPAGASGLTPQVRIAGTVLVGGTLASDRVGLVVPDGGTLVGGDGSGGAAGGVVSGTGSLSWQGGVLGGRLTVGTPVVVSGGTDRVVQAGARLVLGGDSTFSGARLVVGSQAQVTVAGVTTFNGAGTGVARGTSGVDGQLLTIAAGAALQRIGDPGVDAVLDLPVVNQGAVTVSGQLTVPLGFRQQVQTDSQATPVTGLLGSTALLSARRPDGSYGTLDIRGGGIGGVGTVATRRLSLDDAWVHPGFAAAAGTMTVYGDLVLSRKSELQLYVRGTKAEERDVLDVKPLAVNGTKLATGRATLAGSVAALNGPGFTPAYNSVVTGLLRYAARTGSFTAPLRPITPAGLGWAPVYDDRTTDGDGRAVDLRWRDVQPPAVGLAGVPAFSQAASQKLVYEAVDNRSGLKSYDVRWRTGVPTGVWGHWHRPRAWQTTTVGTQTLHGLKPGRSYCFAVRARDRLGNVSAWGDPQCVTRMADDASLALARGWSRVKVQGVLGGSVTRATAKGATLVRAGKVSRIALVVVRCPGCGTLGVYRGDTLVKSLSLTGRSGLRSWVSRPFPKRAGPVRLTVLSSGKPVALDSYGLTR
jgi:hypothetical protein